MPDLLLELFSEEIPARMQARAAEELKAKVTGALVDAGVTYEGAIAHVTPRRLCLHIAGALAASPSISEEKRGPKLGAPEAAIAGFLKGAGLKSIKDARVEGDEKKGEYYIATIKREGLPYCRHSRRNPAKHYPQFFLAEKHALGHGLRLDVKFTLGAAAAFHPLHLRLRDRCARHHRVRSRRHKIGRYHARPPFRTSPKSMPALLRTTHKLRKSACGAGCRAAPRHHLPRRKTACLCAGSGTGRGCCPSR